MNIFSWNVNGIRAVKKKGFFDFLSEYDPDILCLQETKAHVEQLGDDLINIPGYKSVSYTHLTLPTNREV